MRKIFTITVLAVLVGILLRPEPKLSAAPSPRFAQTGKASWYSKRDPGINKKTANNEIFNDQDLTCAIWGVGFNRLIRVTNLDNGRSVIVRVNDRGPHRRFIAQGRIIDLTSEAFRRISSKEKGLINVEIEFL